jgi:hypothetical protein
MTTVVVSDRSSDSAAAAVNNAQPTRTAAELVREKLLHKLDDVEIVTQTTHTHSYCLKTPVTNISNCML